MTACAAGALLLGACKESTRSSLDTPPPAQPTEPAVSEVKPAEPAVVTPEAPKPQTTEDAATEMITGVSGTPTLQQAKEFLETAEREITEMNAFAARAYWINSNFITEDTDAIAALAGEQSAALSTRLANEAKRYNKLTLPDSMARKMDGLKRGSNFPAPDKPGAAKALSGIMTDLNSAYGKGKFEVDTNDKRIIAILDTEGADGKKDGTLEQEAPDGVINLGQASTIIAKSDDPALLKSIWEGWRTISPPMRGEYTKMVNIINEGARELGYKDAGVGTKLGQYLRRPCPAKQRQRC